jgi:hypothetical protein
MRIRIISTLIACALAGGLTLAAGAQMATSPDGEPAGARASDGESIDSIINAMYGTISGPAGPRDWDRFRGLFVEGATMSAVQVRDGESSLTVMAVEDYITNAGSFFEQNAFFETEAARRVETFGRIAHVWTTYESRRSPDDEPFARGINSVQLYQSDDGWRIVSIHWDSERPGVPIPDEYLQ